MSDADRVVEAKIGRESKLVDEDELRHLSCEKGNLVMQFDLQRETVVPLNCGE